MHERFVTPGVNEGLGGVGAMMRFASPGASLTLGVTEEEATT